MSDVPHWFEHGLAQAGRPGDLVVNGARIYYETWGPEAGEAPGLVLIHGSNAHLGWWRFVAPYLARKYRVAALDLSGHGASEHRAHYSGAQFAEEVRGVCEAAQLGARPFVLGHSFGGFVALETAHHYGADLAGVIFNDFTVKPPEDPVEWGRRAEREGRTQPRALRVYKDLDTAIERFRLIPEQPSLHPVVHRWLAEQSLKQVEGGWIWRFDPGLFDYLEMGSAQRDKFATLKCRSAVVLGEYSADDGARSAPYMLEITQGLLPILIIPATHHHMMFEEPLALTMAFEGLLNAWLAEDNRKTLHAALATLT